MIAVLHNLLPYPPAMYRRPDSTASPALDLGCCRLGPIVQPLVSQSYISTVSSDLVPSDPPTT